MTGLTEPDLEPASRAVEAKEDYPCQHALIPIVTAILSPEWTKQKYGS